MEFSTRHKIREQDTIKQMGEMVRGMVSKWPGCPDLTADNDPDGKARA